MRNNHRNASPAMRQCSSCSSPSAWDRCGDKKHKPGSMPEQGLSGLTAAKVQQIFELTKYFDKKMFLLKNYQKQPHKDKRMTK